MKLKIKSLVPGAYVREKTYKGDAGFDLTVMDNYGIRPGRTISVSTGVAVEAPPGFFIRITSRSSTYGRFGVFVNEGIVDNGWRGELSVVVTNPSLDTNVYLKKGDRIAQFLVHRLYEFDLEYVGELSEAERGLNGFGSTGGKG